MTKKINFKKQCNEVFNAINDAKELAKYANTILTQVKDAYTERKAELEKVEKSASKKGASKAKKTEKAESKKAAPKAEKKAKSEKNTLTLGGEEVAQISITDTKALKKLGLKFVPYSEKCLLISGNTKPIHKELKGMKAEGVFGNAHLKAVDGFEGGFGWLVNKNNKGYKGVCKKLGLKAI